MKESEEVKQGLTGYKRALYQSYVTEGLKNGLNVHEAIAKAAEQIQGIPKIGLCCEEAGV